MTNPEDDFMDIVKGDFIDLNVPNAMVKYYKLITSDTPQGKFLREELEKHINFSTKALARPYPDLSKKDEKND